MDAKKMTAAEYLSARGWTEAPDDGLTEGGCWTDTTLPSGSNLHDATAPTVWITSAAVRVQRARDAAEERAAWVRFAANCHASCEGRAEFADAMLTEYRARFQATIGEEK